MNKTVAFIPYVRRARYLEALAHNFTVVTLVHCPLCKGLPPSVTAHPTARLDVGLNMPNPIAGLAVDDEGISGVFSFSGVKHTVTIPWAAVGAVGVSDELSPDLEGVTAYDLDAVDGAMPAPETPRMPGVAKCGAPAEPTNVVRVDFRARRRLTGKGQAS